MGYHANHFAAKYNILFQFCTISQNSKTMHMCTTKLLTPFGCFYMLHVTQQVLKSATNHMPRNDAYISNCDNEYLTPLCC